MPFTLPKKSPNERGAKFREETAPELGQVTISAVATAFNE